MIVKICGITHAEDGDQAARAGADYVGMIFIKRSRRCIALSRAKEITDAVIAAGAEPVAVFETERVDRIDQICQEARIKTVQIYLGAFSQIEALLQRGYQVICALSVETDTYAVPKGAVPLFDCLGGGTGKSFDWNSFAPPKNEAWMLAGGLTPSNVRAAIQQLQPSGVDVASGVEIPGTTRKNPVLVASFIRAAKEA